MNGQFLFKVKLGVSHFKKKKAYHDHNSKASSGTEINLLQRNTSLQFKKGRRKEWKIWNYSFILLFQSI